MSVLKGFADAIEIARKHKLTISFGETEVSIPEGNGAGYGVSYDPKSPHPALTALDELIFLAVDKEDQS